MSLASRVAARSPREVLQHFVRLEHGEALLLLRDLLEDDTPAVLIAVACGRTRIGEVARKLLETRIVRDHGHPRRASPFGSWADRRREHERDRWRCSRSHTGKTSRELAIERLSRIESRGALRALPWVVDVLLDRDRVVRQRAARVYRTLTDLDAPPFDVPALVTRLVALAPPVPSPS